MKDIDWCTSCADAACLLTDSSSEMQRMFAYIVVRVMKDALSVKKASALYSIVANDSIAIMTISKSFYADFISDIAFMKEAWEDELYWTFMAEMLAEAAGYYKYEHSIKVEDDFTVSIQTKRTE